MHPPSFSTMSALGDAFRTTRESQGLSLSDVADRIHIRSVYLAAIEAEDWNAIGPPVYVRGFVRSYARCLGLDPEAAVEAMMAGSPVATAAQATSTSQPARAVRERHLAEPLLARAPSPPRRRGVSFGALAGVVIAFALVLFVGYQYVEYLHGAGTPRYAPAVAPRAAQPVGPVRGVHARTAAPAPQPRLAARSDDRPSGFTVRLRDSSWLRVVVDGRVILEGIYPTGMERSFSGRSATLRAGNAGGVDVLVDGKDLGPMGGLGDVAERSYQLEAR